MEEQKKEAEQSSEHCDRHCGMCQGHGWCGHHCRHFVLRWLLGLLILAIVFGIGLKIGEFKGALNDNYGYYGRGYMHSMMYRPALYQQRFQFVPQSDAQPQGSATTSPKASSTK